MSYNLQAQRYNAGVYALVNDGATTLEYMLDNIPYTLPTKTIITIVVNDILRAEQDLKVHKVAQNRENVVGNGAHT